MEIHFSGFLAFWLQDITGIEKNWQRLDVEWKGTARRAFLSTLSLCSGEHGGPPWTPLGNPLLGFGRIISSCYPLTLGMEPHVFIPLKIAPLYSLLSMISFHCLLNQSLAPSLLCLWNLDRVRFIYLSFFFLSLSFLLPIPLPFFLDQTLEMTYTTCDFPFNCPAEWSSFTKG